MNGGTSQDETTRTPARYLVIGSSGYAGVESTDWNDRALPNIVDFDFILVDVPALTAEKLAAADYRRFEEMRKQLVRFLHSGGELVVITAPRIVHRRENSYPDHLDNYDWSPLSIGAQMEEGESLVKKSDEFVDYLSRMKKWDYYLFFPRDCLSSELTDFYGSTYDTRYSTPCTPIVVNRYDKVLAGRYQIQVRRPESKSARYKKYPSEPDSVTGDIVLLPRIEGLDNREATAVVLQTLTGAQQRSVEPEWCDTIEIPGVAQVADQIQTHHNQIETLLKEIAALQEKMDYLNNYKRLLYGSGPELEDIVSLCFSKLGGDITPARYSQEEFILVFRETEYLVEVKGTGKSCALSHLRQLSDYLLKYQEHTGKNCKGILFANTWRAIPPAERGTNDKPIFPDNVVSRAEQWDVALVSSTDFFSAFLRFLNAGDGSAVLDAIVQQKGVVAFPLQTSGEST